MCEVLAKDSIPHVSNARFQLRQIYEKTKDYKPWVGFEQEYTLFSDNRPFQWPKDKNPRPQGPFYCGVGSLQVYGRFLVEAHRELCEKAGLFLYGVNAEVMPSQWEFQIGYRGIEEELVNPLNISDQLWIARYLLHRLSEEFHIHVSLDNKPMKGDWNGAGLHTNFSTKDIRNPKTCDMFLKKTLEALEKNHIKHIAQYGYNLKDRLTGHHETCSINEFKSGTAHRGASIRLQIKKEGGSYFEDRRPGANADPYKVSKCLLETVCLFFEKRVSLSP